MQDFLQPVVTFDGRCSNRSFAEIPRLCPICGHHADPWRLTAHSVVPDDTAVDFAFQCSRSPCRRIFVAHYRLGPDDEFDLAELYTPHFGRVIIPSEAARSAVLT
jgi:hypothetical protein